jgi:hypothetical protein
MDIWRRHNVVKLPREHGRGKESDRPQGFFARVDEVVPHGRRDDEDITGSDLMAVS